MKKYTLLIIVGSLFLISGLVLSLSMKKDNVYYVYNDTLTIEEVEYLIVEKTKAIVDFYENPKEVFMLDKEIDENSEYFMILNYDTVANQMFTEKGKEEIEKTLFNKKSFINKEEEDIYILKTLPEDNKYSNCAISVSNINYNKDTIIATVSFTKSNIDEKDVLTYYVYEKNIELIKENGKWLINTFIYSNV